MDEYKSFKAKAVLVSKGAAMGVADIIPGVSGGTIAFISGIYEQLIAAVHSVRPIHALRFFQLLLFFWKKEIRERAVKSLSEVHWNFLLPLGTGVVVAILLMSQVVPHLMREFPFYTYSLFFGLIAFSVPLIYKRVERDWASYLVLVCFTLAMFSFMGEHANLAGSTSPLYVFLSGAIAICAMILPGISGSYILVLLGQYLIVLDALHQRDIGLLAIFIAGIAVGIFSFVRLLKFLLEHYHSLTMAALTGIMVGSLRKIWPGNFVPEGGVDTQGVILSVVIVLVGGAIIFFLARFGQRIGDPAL